MEAELHHQPHWQMIKEDCALLAISALKAHTMIKNAHYLHLTLIKDKHLALTAQPDFSAIQVTPQVSLQNAQ